MDGTEMDLLFPDRRLWRLKIAAEALREVFQELPIEEQLAAAQRALDFSRPSSCPVAVDQLSLLHLLDLLLKQPCRSRSSARQRRRSVGSPAAPTRTCPGGSCLTSAARHDSGQVAAFLVATLTEVLQDTLVARGEHRFRPIARHGNKPEGPRLT